MSYEEKVLKFVDSDADEIVKFTQKLVQTPSVTGNEGPVAEVVAKKCEEFGLEVTKVEVEKGRPSVVARFKGTVGKPCLLCYAHYDTVPPGDLSQWLHGPFSGDIADGMIWGRGSTDHKYPIASFLFGLKSLKDAGVQLKGDILFTFVGDEEKGGRKGFKYIVDHGYVDDADFMIYSGGDGKQTWIAVNARMLCKIIVKGKSAHTMRNEEGINAILKAAKVIPRLQKLVDNVNARTHPLTKKARMSINVIHGGATENQVPDTCVITIDRRTTPSETFDQALDELKEVIEEMKKEDPEFQAEATRDNETCKPGSESPPDSPVVKAIQKAGNRILGFVPPAVGLAASSDFAWFTERFKKRPVACYGVGGINMHAANECLKIENLIKATKVYALTIADIAGARLER